MIYHEIEIEVEEILSLPEAKPKVDDLRPFLDKLVELNVRSKLEDDLQDMSDDYHFVFDLWTRIDI